MNLSTFSAFYLWAATASSHGKHISKRSMAQLRQRLIYARCDTSATWRGCQITSLADVKQNWSVRIERSCLTATHCSHSRRICSFSLIILCYSCCLSSKWHDAIHSQMHQARLCLQRRNFGLLWEWCFPSKTVRYFVLWLIRSII